MGSGISITKQQAINIVRREITIIFEEAEKNRRLVDDHGNLLPENFDDEEIYQKRIRQLRLIERTLESYDD
jgi:hypothetical protein